MAGLYVHIPFCKSRCDYCDFYSTTLGVAAMGRYVDALLAEARLRGVEIGARLSTLYLGGGTPSLLPPEQLRRLVDGLRRLFDISGEATIEVNPDDVSPAMARAWRAAGFNRVSMGVQSMVDDELRAVGRRHSSQQVCRAVDVLREAGFDNLSLDVIYGLPGQTLDTLRVTLDALLRLQPEHLSAYCLSYEPGTRLWNRRQTGEVTEADEELCEAMYGGIVSRLRQQGYEHYEISNFALPGRQARHNSAYWDGSPYLGLGAGAHSYDGLWRRHLNPADIAAYEREVLDGGTVAGDDDVLGLEERFEEMVMLGLRTARGVDLDRMERDLGDDYRTRLERAARRHLDDGMLRRDGHALVLTPRALFVSDLIVRDLIGG